MLNPSRRFGFRSSLLLAIALTCVSAFAAEPEVALLIKGHRFEPAQLRVPINTRIKLTVHNQDPTPEEFESHDLNREKLIPAAGKAVIYIGPLKPGRYDFIGEFNAASAKGAIVAE